jgi:hypothetical protein
MEILRKAFQEDRWEKLRSSYSDQGEVEPAGTIIITTRNQEGRQKFYNYLGLVGLKPLDIPETTSYEVIVKGSYPDPVTGRNIVCEPGEVITLKREDAISLMFHCGGRVRPESDSVTDLSFYLTVKYLKPIDMTRARTPEEQEQDRREHEAKERAREALMFDTSLKLGHKPYISSWQK